jgi:3-dehydroquinate synthetase
VLNAGHTVGHALEHESGYRLTHGDAVGLGLIVEATLATGLGLAPDGLAADLARRLGRLGLTAVLPSAAVDDRLLDAMTRDKKVRGGTIRAALPRGPGLAAGQPSGWTTGLAREAVRKALGSTRLLLAGGFPTGRPHNPHG